MSKTTLVHTKRLSPTHIRELHVYYEPGRINYLTYAQKPKGIYFDARVFQQAQGQSFKVHSIRPCQSDPGGSGYLLVAPLTTYRPSLLKAVQARVEETAERLHALCDRRGDAAFAELKALLCLEEGVS
ncbi:hypothetical protein [Palleronia caenipelagi]|uniref:Uncharacterized protein n=1 Tax=Palleronia caenipelagi TaxID=2489174 RepID=A0A547PT46_9RHOB|nr:hypothetical protein [Palleronia caenipelagi]TRD17298.1 hypothetical protein FEV53_13270 [Palleronia caenipelagi]